MNSKKKNIFINLENGKFVTSPSIFTSSIIIEKEYLGETKRGVFEYKLILKRSSINLYGWKFQEIFLKDNYSSYYNYSVLFTLECESPTGEKFSTEFIGYPPRRIKETPEQAVLAVMLAIYLTVLTGNPDKAKEIYSNICTPYLIPPRVDDFLEFYIESLRKIISSIHKLNSLNIKTTPEKEFHNYLIKIYQLGFNHYYDNIKDLNAKIIDDIIN